MSLNKNRNKDSTKKLISWLSVSMLSLASLLMVTNVQAENGNEQKQLSKKRQVKKVPAMRNRVYTQLARAQKLADDGDKIAGFEVLDDVKDRLDSLNSYERAMLWNFYGFMYYSNDDLDNAIDSFTQVVNEAAIPDSLYLSTLYSLAQLAMQKQDYKQTLAFLKRWQADNSKPLNASQQVLFAQVYYQDKQYQQSLMHIKKAVSMAEAKKEAPKENWLILQRASYYELQQPKKVVQVLKKLVRLYDKPQYWLQLSGMYGELEQEDKQLAVMEAAYQAGYVTKGADIITLAQMYMYHGAPYKCAKLLDSALSTGAVKAEEKYLNLLAQAYLNAKEANKAIPVLKQVSKIADTGKFDAQLAQTYLNNEKWQAAIDYATKAIARGGVTQLGNMYLVQGMASFNLKKFDDALSAFAEAEKIKGSKKVAQQWKKYVKRERGYQMRLAMVNS